MFDGKRSASNELANPRVKQNNQYGLHRRDCGRLSQSYIDIAEYLGIIIAQIETLIILKSLNGL